MARIVATILTRPLFVSPGLDSFGEILSTTLMCKWKDVDTTENDFDVYRYSDTERFVDTIAVDTDEVSENDLKGAAVAGTRTSARRFTRTAGTWTASGLVGYHAYSYVDTAPYSGSWAKVTANTTTYFDTDADLTAACNRIALVNRAGFRHSVELGAKEGMAGYFFQTKIVKKLPTTGEFKYYGLRHLLTVRDGWSAESGAAGGAVGNGWTE